MQNLEDGRGQTGQRAHLEAGIFRRKIDHAYFDATEAAMDEDECIREAIFAGALSLMGNRSVELRGLSHQELATKVWEQIRPSASALSAVKGSRARRRHVVATVTRCLTDAALEFWERHAGGDAVTV